MFNVCYAGSCPERHSSLDAYQAVDTVLAGRHVVVSTSTASGKSLCYALPVLEALAADRSACAIFMFPTKALAQVGGHSLLMLDLLGAHVAV